MNNRVLENKLEALPHELKKEALDFIEFLMFKHHQKIKKGKFKFDWEGGLSNLQNKYTSVELQHEASEWR
ncbi:MAG: DUF2281 domain-containing protein [Candidatus Scalindua sp.]|nr:DUF2281 domain-containing protein [Candidatus Scalindua sp.]